MRGYRERQGERVVLDHRDARCFRGVSRENVEIVRAFWKRWLDGGAARLSVSGGEVVYDHRRDPDSLFSHLDPAVEVHPLTGAMLEGASYRGHEGMRQWLEDVSEYWEAMWVEPGEFLDAKDAVVVLGRVHGRGKRSGVAVDSPAAWVCRLRGARLSYLRFYLDASEALDAVGLSEQHLHPGA
jgi:ketosteroid isomerase-like protein